jgi:hypothetical protein
LPREDCNTIINIEILILESLIFSPVSLEIFHFTKLSKIHLYNVILYDDDYFTSLSRCPTLRTFSIKCCDLEPPKSLRNVIREPPATKLDCQFLEHIRVQCNAVPFLTNYAHIPTAVISNYYDRKKESYPVLPNIRKLEMSSSDIPMQCVFGKLLSLTVSETLIEVFTNDETGFPCLKELEIIRCYQLKTLLLVGPHLRKVSLVGGQYLHRSGYPVEQIDIQCSKLKHFSVKDFKTSSFLQYTDHWPIVRIVNS